VSGRYLAGRLPLAADRGVRVRLLLDDINIAGRDAGLAALDRHPNIQIRIYKLFAARAGLGKWLGFIAEFQRLNRRMHNKTFVVDAAFGMAGGRNIGDEYFDPPAEDVHPVAH
jgi:putative cardiolipin synthase